MKALVTDGTGFVGSHLVELLLAAGHEVTCLVRSAAKAEAMFTTRRPRLVPQPQLLALRRLSRHRRGAHGKITVDGEAIRTEKSRSPRAYLEARGRAGTRRPVPASELPFEFMLNTLRLTEGFRPVDFERATGLDMDAIQPSLARLTARGLLAGSGDRLRPTELGFRFLNDLQAAFLPASPIEIPARTSGT